MGYSPQTLHMWGKDRGDLINKKKKRKQGVGEKGRGGELHPECCDWRAQQSSDRHRPGVLQVPRREKHLSGS